MPETVVVVVTVAEVATQVPVVQEVAKARLLVALGALVPQEAMGAAAALAPGVPATGLGVKSRL